jgi:hypothetical protein
MSIVRLVVSVGVMVLTIMTAFRIADAMLVRENAVMILEEPCPVARGEGRPCKVEGSLTHTFVTDDAEIKLRDGTTLIVPRTAVRTVAHLSDDVHFVPFGKLFTGAVGFAVLIIGFLISFAVIRARPTARTLDTHLNQ